MAAEERFDAIISLGVEFDERGFAALENAPEHVRAQLEAIIGTVASLGPALQNQMRALGNDGAAALSAGLESGLRQRIQGLLNEALQVAKPLPSRMPSSGQLYGSSISGTRGNYSLAPPPETGQAEMRYARLVDAATAARQLQIQSLQRSAQTIESETRRYIQDYGQRQAIQNTSPPPARTIAPSRVPESNIHTDFEQQAEDAHARRQAAREAREQRQYQEIVAEQERQERQQRRKLPEPPQEQRRTDPSTGRFLSREQARIFDTLEGSQRRFQHPPYESKGRNEEIRALTEQAIRSGASPGEGLVADDARRLLEAMRQSEPTGQPLYRGLHGDYAEQLRNMPVGSTFTSGVSSWSRDEERARNFGDTVLELAPGARSLPMPGGRFKPPGSSIEFSFDHEQEQLAAGHFRILSRIWDEELEAYRVHVQALEGAQQFAPAAEPQPRPSFTTRPSGLQPFQLTPQTVQAAQQTAQELERAFRGGAQLFRAPGYASGSPLLNGPGPIWQDRISSMGEAFQSGSPWRIGQRVGSSMVGTQESIELARETTRRQIAEMDAQRQQRGLGPSAASGQDPLRVLGQAAADAVRERQNQNQPIQLEGNQSVPLLGPNAGRVIEHEAEHAELTLGQAIQGAVDKVRQGLHDTGPGRPTPNQLNQIPGLIGSDPARIADSVGLRANLSGLASIAEQHAAMGSGTPEAQAGLRDAAEALRRFVGVLKQGEDAVKEEARQRRENARSQQRESGPQTQTGSGSGGSGTPPPRRPAAGAAGDDEEPRPRWQFWTPRQGTPGNDGEQMGRGNPYIGAQNEDGSPRGNWRAGQQHNASRPFRAQYLQGIDHSAMENGSPLDFLSGGLNNMGAYLQYFAALSGSIAVFSAITGALSAAAREALLFNQAAVELGVTLHGNAQNAGAIAQGFGDTGVQAGLSPSTGVELGAIGVRRMAAQGDAAHVGGIFAQQAGRLATLDPTGKAQDYANELGGIAQAYQLNSDQIGEITNAAYIGFHKFGGSISETLKGVEQLGPTARQAHVPLRDLVETVNVINARTGQSGTKIASDLERALQAMGGPEVQKALATAGVTPHGSSYENLQALAARLPQLSSGRQAQVLRDVGGRGGSVGIMLREQGAITDAVWDSVNNPNAANNAFEERMKAVLNVAKQVGAEFLNLGKDLGNSGALAAVGALLAGLKPVLSTLDGIVRFVTTLNGLTEGNSGFAKMAHDASQLAVGGAAAYGILRAIAATNAGAAIAGVVPGAAVSSRALLGGVGGRIGNLIGPGVGQAALELYRTRNISQVTMLDPETGKPLPNQAQGPTMRGTMIRGAVGAAAVGYGVTTEDPTSAGLSTGMGAALIFGSAGAGVAIGGLTFAIKTMAKESKEAQTTLEAHNQLISDHATFSAAPRTAEETQNEITRLRSDADALEKHGTSKNHWYTPPWAADDTSVSDAANAALQRQQAAQLQQQLDEMQHTRDALATSQSSDYAGIFGDFAMQGSGQLGLTNLAQIGVGGTALADAWHAAQSRMTPEQRQAAIGEISQGSGAVAQAAGTAVTNQSGIAVAGAQAALTSAQQDLGGMLSAGLSPDDPKLSAQIALVQQLSNQLDTAVNARIKAVQQLVSSFRSQDDVFGRHNDAIAAINAQLQNDINAHGANSDQAITDRTALNQELQAQIADTVAKTQAQFQAQVDPRNAVDGAAAQVAIAQRNVENSTAGSVAFFQAQAGLRQAQVAYAQTVAESQASDVLAQAHPGSPIEQAQAQIQANNIRLRALRAPLPALADPKSAKGLGLDGGDDVAGALAASQNPEVAGVSAGTQFVTGVTSIDYTAVGASVAAQLAGGATGTGSGALDAGTEGARPGSEYFTSRDAAQATSMHGASVQPTGEASGDMGSDKIGAAAGGGGGGGMLASAHRALAQAGRPIGYDARTQAAIDAGRRAADNALTIANAQQALAIRQTREQAYEGRISWMGAAGQSPIASAQAQAGVARAQAGFVQREDPNHYRENPAWVQAMMALTQAQIAMTQAIRENTRNVRILSSDISDPRQQATINRQTAEDTLRDDLAYRGPHGERVRPDKINADRVGVAQARLQEQSTTFDTNLQLAQTNYQLGQDARFANEAGRMSFSSYMEYLNNERQRLLAVKNRNFEQQRELNAVDQAIASTTAQFQGQWNLGDIKVPTIYEARRSLATSAVGSGGYSDNKTVNITINGADKQQVLGAIKAQLGAPAMARATVGKRVL